MEKKEFRVSPIGFVRADENGFRLEVEEEYRAGLEGLEGFSHVDVLWWCHLLDDAGPRSAVRSERPYRKGPATLGVFATRSPARPNPIAVSVAPVLGIDRAAGVVHIPWIDAEDGTPIVDLKPYHPSIERVRDAAVPEWCGHWPKWYEDSADFDWGAELTHG
ncbi:MAG: SAM-dependent methyltransferase [bacterium]|nr:SAM-dependent methyltransferase [bacterium]